MKKITVKAEKAAEAENTENWNVKVIGLNVEEAKEWTNTAIGKNWTIRYTMPTEESFPCFLLAKRSSESAASNLAQSTITHLETLIKSSLKTGMTAQNTPGKEHTFILTSAA